MSSSYAYRVKDSESHDGTKLRVKMAVVNSHGLIVKESDVDYPGVKLTREGVDFSKINRPDIYDLEVEGSQEYGNAIVEVIIAMAENSDPKEGRARATARTLAGKRK